MKLLKAATTFLILVSSTTGFAFATSPNNSSSSTASSSSNFTVSDAAYAEVSALTYAALRQAADQVKIKIGDNTFIVIDRETIDGQIALASAVAQLTNLNAQFCSAMKTPSEPTTAGQPPLHGQVENFSVSLSAEGGSVLSGIAAIAQLFTPHSSYASTSLNPDDAALEADLYGNGTKLIIPSLYIPPTDSLTPDTNKAKNPCSFSYGVISDAPTDFPTLWLMAQVSDQNTKSVKKPSKELLAVIVAYNDLLKVYLTPQDKGGSLYSQMLRASALSRLMSPDKHPVFLKFGVDVMGGTTNESGHTAFDSKTRYSGGVVVHYIAWRNLPDEPMHIVGAGTVTRTLSGQKIEDMGDYLNSK